MRNDVNGMENTVKLGTRTRTLVSEGTRAQSGLLGTTSRESCSTPNDEPVLVALVQQPVSEPSANELSEELTELLLVKWQQLKADASSAGGVSRQVDYYLNTLVWMKLCRVVSTLHSGRAIEVTPKGTRVCKTSRIGRLQEMANIVFSESVSHAALHGTDVERSHASLPVYWQRLSAETRHRRAGTMKSWIRYFREVADEQARRPMGGL
jgi:hypothetical protein